MMKILLVSLLLLSCWEGLQAKESFIPPFTAHYKLYYGGIPAGMGTRTLTPIQNGKFIFESIAKTAGLISVFRDSQIEERSIFTRTNGKIRPLEYTYHQTGKKSKDKKILFNWSEGIAKSTFDNKTKNITLQEGILDNLLYQLVLMQELMQGKQQLQYKIVDKEKVKTYIPTFLGQEKVETKLGILKVLKYERFSPKAKRRTTFWCAPTFRYLPVRIEHIEKEGSPALSMVLQSIKGLN